MYHDLTDNVIELSFKISTIWIRELCADDFVNVLYKVKLVTFWEEKKKVDMWQTLLLILHSVDTGGVFSKDVSLADFFNKCFDLELENTRN